jgi:uncharacterized protein YybS (DUF2232 family)
MTAGVRPESRIAAVLLIIALFPASFNLSLVGFMFIPGIAAVIYLWFIGSYAVLIGAIVVSVLAAATVFGYFEGFYMLIGFAIPAVTLASLLERRQGLVKSGLAAMIAPIAALAVNHPTLRRLIEFVTTELQRTMTDPELAAIYSVADYELIVRYLNWMVEAMQTLMPSILLISVATILFAGGVLGIMLVRKQDIFVYGFRNFSRWKIPEWMLAPLALSVVLLLTDVAVLGLIGWNLLFLLFLLYSICGLSVVEYLMRRKKFSLSIRILVYLALFLAQIFAAAVLPLIALFDSHFDYRRLRAKQIG